MPTGKEYATRVNDWVQQQFAARKFIFYIKTKHLAADLKMKSGEVSHAFRLLRKMRTEYYVGKKARKHTRTWVIIHPVVIVAKFLAAFSPKDSRIRREYY